MKYLWFRGLKQRKKKWSYWVTEAVQLWCQVIKLVESSSIFEAIRKYEVVTENI